MQEFTSLAALGRHFGRLALEGEAVTNRVTEKVADIVKQDAQVKIGVYQEAAGQFPAWAPLADSTVADRISKGFSPLEPLLRTGELRDSIETHVEGAEATVGSASMIALYQEQGTDRIPPRPFLGPALFEGKVKIGREAATHLVAWIAGLSWRRPQPIRLP